MLILLGALAFHIQSYCKLYHRSIPYEASATHRKLRKKAKEWDETAVPHSLLSLAPLLLFSLIICIDSAMLNRSLKIGLLSVLASFIQLLGYGTGFIRAWWARCVMGRNEELQAFKKSFYK